MTYMSQMNASYGMGLNPIKLEVGLLKEVIEISTKYKDRANLEMIPCVSKWKNIIQ